MKNLIKSAAGGAVAGIGTGMELNEETSIDEFMGKNSAQYVLNPSPHLDPPATEKLDIREFMSEFTHEMDEMNGLYNVVRDVSETIESKSGDCVDYSAVAASWIIQHTNSNPKIIVYAPAGEVKYGHMNTYGCGRVYDYHGIYNKNPENYAKSFNNIKLLYVTDPIS
jgi:hypothetical protein